MNKTLVTYFSATNTTKRVAEKINRVIEEDLFEIKPVKEYTNEDLNWTNKTSRTSIEMDDINSRPEIENKVSNISEYDKVLIGFPIWWYTCPRIINTFIEENDLTNKKIYLFATSGGSGIEQSINDLKKMYPNLNIVDGKRLSMSFNNEEIISWLN